jgi:putative intracellular protease/amidase
MTTSTVHCFVFDTLADWEYGFAVAGINNTQFHRLPNQWRVRTVASRRGAIVTTGGVRIVPDLTLGELSPSESRLLILPGGDTWDEGGNRDAVEKAREFLASGVPVAAICGATAGLARGGLLDAVRHTSNAREYIAATGYRGGGLYQEEPAVTDGDVITAASMAPLEFAYHIYRRLDLYAPDVLEAWYGLFSTRKPEYFAELMRAAEALERR